MNQNLQFIFNLIQQSEKLDAEQKDNLLKAVKDADKELEITAFKLERTEKVKKTTAILLEETIEELEQKRKAVEEQNRELEIETALEKVRSSALAMNEPANMVDVCHVISDQLQQLDVNDIRNVQTAIINEQKGTYLNYQYFSAYEEGTTEETVYSEHPTALAMVQEMKKSANSTFSGSMKDKELATFREWRKQNNQFPDPLLDETDSVHYYFYSIGLGGLGLTTYKPLPEEGLKIFKRFHNVFTLAYRRFIDIEKANAQAREAQIEAALERVRSKAMAMHNSENLLDTISEFFVQLKILNIIPVRCGVAQMFDNPPSWTAAATNATIQGDSVQLFGKVEYLNHPVLKGIYDHWIKQENYFPVLQGEEIKKYYKALRPQINIPEFPEGEIHHGHYFNFREGNIFAWTKDPLSEEEKSIFVRFSSVLSLTYRRYIDLEKTEAQAREAQIEVALERVRSRTMGMQKSDELKEVIQLVYDQFVYLNIHVEHTGFILDYKARDDMHIWLADKNEVPFEVTFPYFDCAHWNSFIEAKEKGKDFFANHLSFEEKNKFYKDLFELIPGVSEETAKYYLSCPGLAISTVLMDNVGLYMENFSGTPYTDEDNKILMRFGRVFQQTYTRFLDLKKAEAQAREAQIEASLERVRNRTIAMQQSDEFSETAGVLFQQFVMLRIIPKRCVIGIIDETKNNVRLWFTSSDGKVVPGADLVPLTEQENLINLYEAWKNDEEHFNFRIEGQERVEWTSYMMEKAKMHLPEYQPESIDKQLLLNEPAVFNNFFFTNGFVMLHTVEELKGSDIPMLKRFARVFEQTYTRFLDLKKAEAQAREAQIEAALERVRAKAMAMHSSDDISDTMGVVFTELPKLKINSLRCGVVLLSKDSYKGVFYAAATTEDSDSQTVIGEGDMSVHPIFMNQREYWTRNENYFVTLSDEELKSYYKEIFRRSSTPYNPKDHEVHTEHGYYFAFSEGMFYAWTEVPYSESDIKILERFKSIIDLTFRRYIDLKKAEAQAQEAIKQASLDRVRGEIASMRTSEDLNRITPVIWRELKTLEVPFVRCGVFIVNEADSKTYVYLSTPDGKALAVLDLAFEENELTKKTVEHWRKKKVYKEHWNKEQFINWTKSMMELGQVKNAETYQGSSKPPESLDLHFIPFMQGMLYVGNTSQLTDEKLYLVKTLAEAFSIAYARYEDFKNLEEAKNKVEITLKELKAAQSQLIHSEKMASLGELTAGIAHEIKNPLNFVNNFSEISSELLDDVKEELQKNNNDEVLILLDGLKQNLEKINQHGKRADSIVRGMLLHSRGTSGEKTLTDINDLLDQYVNLAYHGMRATNREFNISIEKNYDETLNKINVIPQDLSRVFLNVINNACYAAYERKKKSSDNNFSPTLKVSTKNLKEKVEIRIGDNGNGIPANILDKIFQPFFTTKPTGEGTGLGLSLSYDIVTKVHNGELKVETKEGEGSLFIVLLPVN